MALLDPKLDAILGSEIERNPDDPEAILAAMKARLSAEEWAEFCRALCTRCQERAQEQGGN